MGDKKPQNVMLEVADLHAYYAKSHILQGVSFVMNEGEIVSLLGRNGVGRSTTLRTIIGEVAPFGVIRFNRGAEPNRRIRLQSSALAMCQRTGIFFRRSPSVKI